MFLLIYKKVLTMNRKQVENSANYTFFRSVTLNQPIINDQARTDLSGYCINTVPSNFMSHQYHLLMSLPCCNVPWPCAWFPGGSSRATGPGSGHSWRWQQQEQPKAPGCKSQCGTFRPSQRDNCERVFSPAEMLLTCVCVCVSKLCPLCRG